MLEGLRADVAFISETWESVEQPLTMPGYTWVSNPRTCANVNQNRCSGGVGFMIKNTILQKYRLQTISKDTEGVIVILLIDKMSKTTIMLIGCYLPPDSSIYGRHIEQTLDNITNLLYEHTDVDFTYMMGDMNSRVGNLKDFIPEIDDLPERIVIDATDNSHGHALVDFLIETKLAIVNGRCCPLSDSFTCISHKGSSIVDYLIAAHENFHQIIDFEVLPVTEVIDNLQLMGVAEGRVSEHSLLKMSIHVEQNDVWNLLQGDSSTADPTNLYKETPLSTTATDARRHAS